MARRFFETTLRPLDLAEAGEFFRLAALLGYCAISLVLDPRRLDAAVELKRSAAEWGLDFVSRIDVTADSNAAMKRLLRKFRRRVELISVRGLDRRTISFGCRDRRVDLVTVERCAKFYRGDLDNLLSQDKSVELVARPLLRYSGRERGAVIRVYREVFERPERRGVKVVVGSGAQRPLEIRGPRELAALFAEVLDASQRDMLDAISTNPLRLVERNRFKLSEYFIMPGVYLYEGGDAGGEEVSGVQG